MNDLPDITHDHVSPLVASAPSIADYFRGWAIHQESLFQQVKMVGSIDLEAHIKHAKGSQVDPVSQSSFNTTQGGAVALLSMAGPMMKGESSFGGASTVRMRRQIRAAANDASVEAIVIAIDSPGGTVAGTKDLADDIAAANAQKPVVAFIEDMGASAAYWAASQAMEIHVNATGMVGSIGTFAVIYDASRAAEEAGIKVHVIRAGEFKGAGTVGTEITDEQLAEWQRTIDELNMFFVEAVAKGRGMPIEQARQLADGRVHIGKAAVNLGLADAVGTIDQAVTRSLALARKEKPMSEKTTPQPATIDQIEAACPGADSDFLLAQVKAGATVQDAMTAFIARQGEALEAQTEAAAEATKKAEKAAAEAKEAGKAKSGVEPLVKGQTDDLGTIANPTEAWNAALNAKVDAGMKRERAIKTLVRERPDLHRAYVAAFNEDRGRTATFRE